MRDLPILALLLVGCAPKDTTEPSSPDTDPIGDTDLPGDTGLEDTDPPVDTDVLDTGGLIDTDLPGCVTIFETDADADGTADFRRVTREDVGFTVVDVDDEADGQVDLRTETTWSASGGLVVLRETHALPSNTLTYRATTTEDAQGRPVRMEEDADGDGVVSDLTEWTYHPIGTSASQLTTEDLDDDGTPDRTTLRTFDTSGRIVALSRDDGADGTVDGSESWTWLPDSDLHEVFGAGGTLVNASQNEYDALGRLVFQRRDNDGDGTFTSSADEVFGYTWTANGQPDVDTQDGVGGAPDGVPDIREERVYDGSGRLLSVFTTVVATSEVTDRVTWTYDASGNQDTQENDLDGDGVIQSGWVRTFDANGRVLVDTTLQGGVPVAIVTRTWTPNGQLATEHYDGDADGTADSISVNTWDALGRLLRNELDLDGDGVPDTIQLTSFTCP